MLIQFNQIVHNTRHLYEKNSHPHLSFPHILINIKKKKVPFKNQTDPQQKFSVYALPFKDIVHITPVTIQLTGKPRYGTFLILKFLLNQVPDMDIMHDQ